MIKSLPNAFVSELSEVIGEAIESDVNVEAIEERLRVGEALVSISHVLIADEVEDWSMTLGIIGEALGVDAIELSLAAPARDYVASDERIAWHVSTVPAEQAVLESVPVTAADGALYGALDVYADEPLNPTATQTLTVLGNLLAGYFGRQRKDQALSETQARVHHLIERHPEPICLIIDGVIQFANEPGARLLGVAADEIDGRSFFDFVSAAIYDQIERHWVAMVAEQASNPIEHEVIRLDGEERIVQSYHLPVVYEGRGALQVIMRDVTEERRDQQRYEAFLETASEAFWRLDVDPPMGADRPLEEQVQHVLRHARLVECNQVLADAVQADSPEEIAGMRIQHLLGSDAETLVRQFIEGGYRLRGQDQTFEARPLMPARHFVFNALGTVRYGRLVTVWGSSTEVTERIELERRMVSALEEQQDRIGRDLHDSVGQYLTGVRMLSRNLAERLGGDPHKQQADKIVRYADEASEAVQTIYRGLTPTRIDRGSLVGALEDLVTTTDGLPGIRASFEFDPGADVLDSAAKLQLYRIAQEATNNAIKYAQASHLEIRLERNGQELTLSVADDGIGFDFNHERQKSIGLFSMTYRARQIRGELEVDTVPGDGTVVRCSVDRFFTE